MINYKFISDSIEYYQDFGFKRIESPWTVSKYIDDLTKPKDITSFQLKHNDKCLVASGEQSFLYLYLKEFLPLGQFQTTTPCFRFETFDYYHSKYFIKNELIKTDIVNSYELEKIVNLCLNFFKKFIPQSEVKQTNIGFDIVYKEFELGSYGVRECEFLKWIYATGCAEPRLSKIVKVIENGLP